MNYLRNTVILVFILICPKLALSNECGDWFSNFTSPVCTDAKYIFWTGATLTLGLRVLKDQKSQDEIQSRAYKKNHLKSLGGLGGELGGGYLNAAYFLGQLMFGGQEGGK